jgi:hypothetical protein
MSMDPKARAQRIQGLETIKNKALDMARKGSDSFEVRNFVTDAKKELAYELPDQEAFGKAVNATRAYKAKQGQ